MEKFDTFDEADDPEMQMVIPFDDLEKEIYVDRLTVEYEGPFDLQRVRAFFVDWAKKHQYAKEDRESRQIVKKAGKNIHLVFRLQKWVSNKFLVFMNVFIDFYDVVDIEVERDGKKVKIQKGKVKLIINGFLASCGEKDRWEAKAYMYFLRELIDKFVYKIDRGKHSGVVIADANDLAQKLKAYMNLTRFKVPKEEGGKVHEHSHRK